MAKREITAASSPTEVRIANEQLVKAQQDYKAALVPYTGKSLSLIEQDKIAQSIASKYDYVDFGPDPALVVPGEINIGGINTFYVKGLKGQSKTNFPPEAKTIINKDDAFPTTDTARPPVNTSANPKTNNPNQQKIDQSTTNESSPQTVTQTPAVQPESTVAGTTNTTGQQDAQQAGAALERNNKAQATQAQDGIVSDNRNELPVSSNNRPGRLSDEFVQNPSIADGRNAGNSDDAALTARPMGTAIGGFDSIENISASPDPARSGNTGAVTIGSTESIPVPQAAAGTNNKPGITVRQNILHQYANWTYKIAWYMLPLGTYNGMISSGTVAESEGRLISQSGGAGGNADQALAGDLYFRNLRFTSVVGNRQQGAATNNFELEMTVVEPYSASLIGELGVLALQLTGEESISPAEVPYLLAIDFTGYKDDGTPVLSILGENSIGKKYIPVRILSVDMRLESAGAVYTFSMAPYSFYAFTPRYAEMEVGPTLKGKTVEEILGDQGQGLIAELNKNEQFKVDSGQITVKDDYAIEFYSFNEEGNISPELQQSPVAYPTSGGNVTQLNIRSQDNNVVEGTYTVTKGSLIKDTIKNLVLCSQYFNERVDPSKKKDGAKDKPAELIKVIPVIEFKNEFDAARNEYAKKITYKVFNTLLWGEIHPGVGSPDVENWGFSKIYNWLFTGKNEDVIEADLSFQFIYYARLQSNILDYATIKSQTVAESQRAPTDQSTSRLGISNKTGNLSNSGPNMPQRYINAAAAQEWFDGKMMGNTEDNIAINLRIIGDPDWIPQDASIRGGDIAVGTDLVDENGSIAVDVAGVYVKLNLRTPRDYNDKTGLMDLQADQTTVQGMYQVITVESIFEDGKFTQNLQMVKIPAQKEENPGAFGTAARQTYNNRVGRGGPPPSGLDPALRGATNPAVNVNGNLNPTPNGTRA